MKPILAMLFVFLLLAHIPPVAAAPQAKDNSFSGVEVKIGGASGQDGLALPLRILVFLTLLSLIPALILSVTSFTRIIIVTHFLRQALGTQTMPPNQVLIGLALFLTFFIMQPVGSRINEVAIQPMLQGRISEMQALEEAGGPLRDFMLRYTREKDLLLFLNIAKEPRPATGKDLPMRVVIPSFMISELKTAFQMGFVIFIPFLIIDMVVASVILSMGMMQLPPIVISTPLKILLFVMVDGWNLVVGSLVRSFF